jgi:hypothetical protein
MRGEVSCSGGVSIGGRGVELIDRTPGQDRTSTGCYDAGYGGCVLGTPNPISPSVRERAVSEGSVEVYDWAYPKATDVEVVLGVWA